MLTTEDQSKELTIPKNSNIPIILIDSISETANKSTSLNSEISRFNSQSMIDIESNNPVFVHNFTSNQKIDRNRQLFNELNQNLIQSKNFIGSSHRISRSKNNLLFKSILTDNMTNKTNNFLLKNYTRKSKSRVS
jgi:hypothetical protein